jgi:hypothetical protein
MQLSFGSGDSIETKERGDGMFYKKKNPKNIIKIILYITLFLLFLLYFFGTGSSKAFNLKEKFVITMDEKETVIPQNSIQPFFWGDRILVPAHMLENILNYDAQWSDDFESIIVRGNGKVVEMKNNEAFAVVNGKNKSYDTREEKAEDLYPVVYYDRLFIPIRFIVEEMGADIKFENTTDEESVVFNLMITSPNKEEKSDENEGSKNVNEEDSGNLNLWQRILKAIASFFQNITKKVMSLFNR